MYPHLFRLHRNIPPRLHLLFENLPDLYPCSQQTDSLLTQRECDWKDTPALFHGILFRIGDVIPGYDLVTYALERACTARSLLGKSFLEFLLRNPWAN